MIETSIIIPVYNREKFITACLHSLTEIHYQNFEIIVVDDGSTDHTATEVEKFTQRLPLKLIRLSHNMGVCAARNIGIENSIGEYLAFIDSDCTVDPEWPTALLDQLKNSKLDAISGAVIDFPARISLEEALVGTNLIAQNKIQGRMLIGCNMLFKSKILNQFKFDQTLVGAEEDDLQIRLLKSGKKIQGLAKGFVNHDHPISNWNEFFKLCKIRGHSAAQISYKHNRIIRDLFFIQLCFIFLLASFFKKILLYFALASFLLQIIAIFYNETAFKNKSIDQTLKAFHILLYYHLVKAFFFSEKMLLILLSKDKKLIESKKEWQNQILQRKHSSCCSIQ